MIPFCDIMCDLLLDGPFIRDLLINIFRKALQIYKITMRPMNGFLRAKFNMFCKIEREQVGCTLKVGAFYIRLGPTNKQWLMCASNAVPVHLTLTRLTHFFNPRVLYFSLISVTAFADDMSVSLLIRIKVFHSSKVLSSAWMMLSRGYLSCPWR